MIDFIASILGAIIKLIYNLVGQNYGLSIIVFTIITKAILFPMNLKQSRSMESVKKIAPLEKEIREKYKGNNEKMSEELAKMYSENKINPLGGCLPLLIQFPIIIAMLYIVKQPLTYIMDMPKEELTVYTQEYLEKLEVTDAEIKEYEIQIANEKNLIDMNFLGINFGDVPSKTFDIESENRPSKLTLIIPILSVVLSFLQIKQSQKNSTLTEEQLNQQKTMNFMMPILSGYISYIMPVALGIYWLLGNVLGMLTQLIINKIISKEKVKLIKGE